MRSVAGHVDGLALDRRRLDVVGVVVVCIVVCYASERDPLAASILSRQTGIVCLEIE